MIKNMLEAVSSMLGGSEEPKVECAKIMLDKIIEGMAPPMVKYNPPNPMEILECVEPEPPKEEEPYRLTKDVDGNLKLATGKIPAGTKIEVDGKVMLLTEALGKPFKKCKIL